MNNRWNIVYTVSIPYTISKIMYVASFFARISSMVKNKIKNPIIIAPTSPAKHFAFFLKLNTANINDAISKDIIKFIGIIGVSI